MARESWPCKDGDWPFLTDSAKAPHLLWLREEVKKGKFRDLGGEGEKGVWNELEKGVWILQRDVKLAKEMIWLKYFKMILLLWKMGFRGPRWIFQKLFRKQVNAVWRWGGDFWGSILCAYLLFQQLPPESDTGFWASGDSAVNKIDKSPFPHCIYISRWMANKTACWMIVVAILKNKDDRSYRKCWCKEAVFF